MKCPACQADVEDGADLCLECGEPMGDSPAARVARGEATPVGSVAVVGKPATITKPGSPPIAKSDAAKPDAAKPEAAKPAAAADASAKPVARRKWPVDEPEPLRCPGCGTKTFAVRCPGCGTKLRHDDD